MIQQINYSDDSANSSVQYKSSNLLVSKYFFSPPYIYIYVPPICFEVNDLELVADDEASISGSSANSLPQASVG